MKIVDFVIASLCGFGSRCASPNQRMAPQHRWGTLSSARTHGVWSSSRCC